MTREQRQKITKSISEMVDRRRDAGQLLTKMDLQYIMIWCNNGLDCPVESMELGKLVFKYPARSRAARAA